jgi:integrase
MSEQAPSTVNRTLRRRPNAEYRPREYLTESEVTTLIEAARNRGRNGPRDACAILLAYRHGLRANELCALQWTHIDLRSGRMLRWASAISIDHGRHLHFSSRWVHVRFTSGPLSTRLAS